MAQLKLPEVNVVIVAGRLTADPDFRTTSGGTAVGNLSLAVNRRVKSKQGEWTDDATFIDAVIWGEYAERWKPRLKKGAPVIVQGSLRSNKWETKDGQKRTTIEIVVNKIQTLERMHAPGSTAGSGASEDETSSPVSSDEVPF